jgi:hypothetical protein
VNERRYDPQEINVDHVMQRLEALRLAWLRDGIPYVLTEVGGGQVRPQIGLAFELPTQSVAELERQWWSDTYRALRRGPLREDHDDGLRGMQLLMGHLDIQEPVHFDIVAMEGERSGFSVWSSIAPHSLPSDLAQSVMTHWTQLVFDVLRDGAGLDLSTGSRFSEEFNNEMQRRLRGE